MPKAVNGVLNGQTSLFSTDKVNYVSVGTDNSPSPAMPPHSLTEQTQQNADRTSELEKRIKRVESASSNASGIDELRADMAELSTQVSDAESELNQLSTAQTQLNQTVRASENAISTNSTTAGVVFLGL